MDKHSSRRDIAQINKLVYDEVANANRVVDVSEKSIAFNLSHKDGDTIATHVASRTLAPGKHDCSDLQKFQAYGSGIVVLYADANSSCEIQVTTGQIVEFCAMSLKTDVTLVGR